MNDSDLLRRLALLERRNGYLILAVIGLTCAVAFLLYDFAEEILGQKSLVAESIYLSYKDKNLDIHPGGINIWTKDRFLALRPESIELRNFENVDPETRKKSHKLETLDRSPPGTETIFIGLTANVSDETPLPHIEIRGSKDGFPCTFIGKTILTTESPGGKKTLTEYPASSIIFFDETGHTKAILP